MSKSCCSNKKNDGTESGGSGGGGLTEPVNFTQSVGFPDGTVSSPSIVFTDDLNTGIYRVGADSIGITTAGAKRMELTDQGILMKDGNSTAPSYSFFDAPGFGMYKSGPTQMSFATNSTQRLVIDNGGVAYTVPIAASDGSVSSPGISFNSDLDTGIYRKGTDDIGVSAGGTEVFNITSAGVFNSVQSRMKTDGAGALSITNNVITDYSLWTNPAIQNIGFTFDGTTLTIPEDGLYIMSYSMRFAGNSTGRRACWIQDNNAFRYGYSLVSGQDANDIYLNGSFTGQLLAGDTLTVRVWQTSGGNLQVGNNNSLTALAVARIL